MTAPSCRHVTEVRAVRPREAACAECLAAGQRWVQLRVCLFCGHVGCCDASPGRHAAGHFRDSGHPIARSWEGDWAWCFVHQAIVAV